jgi:hypothetical protein
VHEAPRAGGAGCHDGGRRARAGHLLRSRSGAGGVQPRRDDPLARLQRHLARRGMGASLGQPRRHPPGRRLAVAPGHRRRAQDAHGAGRHHRDDQGARDPGRDRSREQLQPRRPRPRFAGAGGLDGGGDADARRHEAAGDRRGVERVDRRRRASHLPPRAQCRLAQELGRGRRREPRRAPRADLARGRDGLSCGALRGDLGLLRRALPGPAVPIPPGLRQLRDGERALQDRLSRRVPRADRGGMRAAAAPGRSGTAWRTSTAW